jgi:uncharacterized protein YndB with AHSA1/START domain
MSATDRHGTATVTLQSDREIVITRLFDAPAALVFKALTTPELVRRWWGFETSEWLVCEIDLREGGHWRYVTRETRGSDSFEVGFHGEYRSIHAPQRIVSTEVFEGFSDPSGDVDEGGALNTITLEESDGVTTMTTLVVHAKPEHRDMHIASGMEGGMQISMNRLDDLVAELDHAGQSD